MGLPKRKWVFQPSSFRGYVSFREGNLGQVGGFKNLGASPPSFTHRGGLVGCFWPWTFVDWSHHRLGDMPWLRCEVRSSGDHPDIFGRKLYVVCSGLLIKRWYHVYVYIYIYIYIYIISYIYIPFFVGKYVWEDMSCSNHFFLCFLAILPSQRVVGVAGVARVESLKCVRNVLEATPEQLGNKQGWENVSNVSSWKTNMGTPNLNWMFGSDDFLIFWLGEFLKSMSNYAGHCNESKESIITVCR